MNKVNHKGLTIIELLVSLSISLIVLAEIYHIFIISKKTYTSQINIAEMHQNARASLELITRDLQNLSIINSICCVQGNSSIDFATIEEIGTVSENTSTTLTDGSKTWKRNQWKNHFIAIMDNDREKNMEGKSTEENSGLTLKDNDKAWQHNQWQNYSVTITHGVGYGQNRLIVSNTETQLFLSQKWQIIPDNHSFYRIWQIKQIITNKKKEITISAPWLKEPGTSSFYQIMVKKGFFRNTETNILEYTKGGSTQPFAENIISFTLEGYNAAGSIGKLTVSLTAKTSKEYSLSEGDHSYTVETSLLLNNFQNSVVHYGQ